VLLLNYFAISHQSVQNKCGFAINTAAPMNGTSAKRAKDRQRPDGLSWIVFNWSSSRDQNIERGISKGD